MLLLSRLFGAPLVWSARSVAVPHSTRYCPPATRMFGGGEDAVHSYAGIFSESPGITKAWSLPGEGSETLLVQRTARNIEGASWVPFTKEGDVGCKCWWVWVSSYPARFLTAANMISLLPVDQTSMYCCRKSLVYTYPP